MLRKSLERMELKINKCTGGTIFQDHVQLNCLNCAVKGIQIE